jgi:transposase
MAQTGKGGLQVEGPAGSLPVQADDKLTRQLAMLIEGKCLGLGPSKAARKYGYSKQRFFQVLKAFVIGGSKALIPKKTGPKSNYVRTENVVSQIIRHRFLDPEAKAEVIAQKMRQTGIKVSQRTVERTITEYGLQKKTLQVSAPRQRRKD